MRHPSKAQVQQVIDTLREYTALLNEQTYPVHVDFAEGDVTRWPKEGAQGGSCRTVACFAGHYQAALVMRGEGWRFGARFPDLRRLVRMRPTGEAETVYFNEGRDAIAEALGFESGQELCAWAAGSPEVWGNAFGALMFEPAGGLAFGGRIPQADVDEHQLDSAWDPDYLNHHPEADTSLAMSEVLHHLEGVRDRLPA